MKKKTKNKAIFVGFFIILVAGILMISFPSFTPTTLSVLGSPTTSCSTSHIYTASGDKVSCNSVNDCTAFLTNKIPQSEFDNIILNCVNSLCTVQKKSC